MRVSTRRFILVTHYDHSSSFTARLLLLNLSLEWTVSSLDSVDYLLVNFSVFWRSSTKMSSSVIFNLDHFYHIISFYSSVDILYGRPLTPV